MDTLFVIMTERDECTYTAYNIPGFEKEESVGYCWKFKNGVTGRKIYDIFPYVDWFNGKQIKG